MGKRRGIRGSKKRGVTHVSPLKPKYIPKLLNYSLLPNLKNKLQRLFVVDNAAKLQSLYQISKFSTKNFTFQTIEYIF